ncbi:MAG: acyl carrier protein [Lewinella sp.]|uniref:acyl carrier protein n=1 Tax=Lewinella sp. TaxID=2004506 RepID=UPI003D6C57D6
MSEQEILNKLEEAFEVDEGSLTASQLLDDMPEFDSMTKLTLIVLADDDFDKRLSAEQINDFNRISDIIIFLQE